MPTGFECVGCREYDRTAAKISEANDSAVTCINGHTCFEGVCLIVRVLQAAYFQYRHEHGSSSSPPSLYIYVQNNNSTEAISFHYYLDGNIGTLLIVSKQGGVWGGWAEISD